MKNGVKSHLEVISLNKSRTGILLLGVLLAGFSVGYILANLYRSYDAVPQQQKPVLQVQEMIVRIDSKTPVVFEKEYLRSDKVVISDFQEQKNLIGLTVEEIRKKYTEKHGFRVVYEDGSLLINQVVNDWCPDDKDRCRLKSYRGFLAIYRGPSKEENILLRVTALRMETLPPRIQQAVNDGTYEFASESELNDALENLDEYLP